VSYSAAAVRESCSHRRPHEGQALKFIKELSANTSCVSPTLELILQPLSMLAVYPVPLGYFGDEQLSGQGTASLLCPGEGQVHDTSTLTAMNRAGVEPI